MAVERVSGARITQETPAAWWPLRALITAGVGESPASRRSFRPPLLCCTAVRSELDSRESTVCTGWAAVSILSTRRTLLRLLLDALPITSLHCRNRRTTLRRCRAPHSISPRVNAPALHAGAKARPRSSSPQHHTVYSTAPHPQVSTKAHIHRTRVQPTLHEDGTAVAMHDCDGPPAVHPGVGAAAVSGRGPVRARGRHPSAVHDCVQRVRVPLLPSH